MNFVSIISAIVTFIRFIPELIKIWKEVTILLRDIGDAKDAKDKAKEITQAIKKAQETKDTSDLEQVFGPKSFDIKFTPVEEKKSLDLGAIAFDVKIKNEASIKDTVEQFFQDQQEKNPLKEIEKLVLETPEASNATITEEATPIEQKSTFSFFGFMGGSDSTAIGASFVNHVFMSGGPRMKSKFFVILILLPFINGCKTDAINQPNYKPKLYAGDSAQGGLYRKQSGELIRATDPKMDDMVGMTYSTFACVHKTYIQNCREYKEAVVRCDGLDEKFYEDIIKSQ